MLVQTQTIREQIDPNGTLPSVTLERDQSKKDATGGTRREESNHLVVDGKRVGSAMIGRDLIKKEAWFNGIEVDQKGKGFGTAAYLAAIEQAHANGEAFRNHDYGLTPEAAALWNRFIEAGVATVVTPLERKYSPPSEITGGDVAQYDGHVQVPPPELH